MPKTPRLAVFDLDFTLWDAGGTWCDHLTPPFIERDGQVFDQNAWEVQLYPDVVAILDRLDSIGCDCAIASRTEAPDSARELLELFDIEHRFAFSEIYPAPKREHFQGLSYTSEYSYSEMIFFDDEQRNIDDVEQLGVLCCGVSDGIDMQLVTWALEQYDERVL